MAGRKLMQLLLTFSLLFMVTHAQYQRIINEREDQTASVTQTRYQRFVIEPPDQTALVNTRVILPCRVTDKEGILQWTKDDFGLGIERNLSGYDRYSIIGFEEDGDYYLEIYPVTIEDDGKYQCQVLPGSEYEREIRSVFAFLTVLVTPEPPKIIQGDYFMTYEYLEIKLECVSYGAKPPAKIIWIDDHGNFLTNWTTDTVEVLSDGKRFVTKSILKMVPRKEDNNRNFTCRAQNAAEATPQIAKLRLEVKYPPHVTVTILSGASPNGFIPEGGDVRLGCEVDANPPNITYSWFVDEQFIEGNFTTEVVIPNVNRYYQKAIVKCRAYNEYGKSEEGEILYISYGPQFRNKPESVLADAGETVTLSCDVVGNPLPDVSWMHLYEENQQIVGVDPNLTLRVGTNTAGRYRCKAHVMGFVDVEADATVYLKGPPFIESPRNQFGIEGDTVRIDCTARSVPAANFVLWTFNGLAVRDEEYSILEHRLPEGIKSVLIIRESQKRHFGLYKCNVTNSYGYDLLEVHLIPKEASQAMLIFNIVFTVVLIIVAAVILVVIFFWSMRCNRKKGVDVDHELVKRQFEESNPTLDIPEINADSVPSTSRPSTSACHIYVDVSADIEPGNKSMPTDPENYVVMTPKAVKNNDGYVGFSNYKLDYCPPRADSPSAILDAALLELDSLQLLNFYPESGLSTYETFKPADIPNVSGMDPRFNTENSDFLEIGLPKPKPPPSDYVKVGYEKKNGLTVIYE